MIEAPQKPAGDWEKWNERWPAIGAGEQCCMYTRGIPKNDGAENHQRYYKLLSGKLRSVADWQKWRFLELGAGRATTSMYLMADGAADVTLLDLSQECFKIVAKNWREHRLPTPKCAMADCCNTGLPDASYDCIYNVGLLEHFWEDPRPVLCETVRLLAPGGLLFSIIVQSGGGMNRTQLNCDEWQMLCWELGQPALCEELPGQPGVLLLSGWKPGA